MNDKIIKTSSYLMVELGNKIMAKGGVINLSLSGGATSRTRKLGVIDFQKRKLIVKRNRERHVLRKANAYGFNYYLLSESVKFDNIFLKDYEGIYDIPKKDILNKGSFLFFKQQGFEKQIFMPLEEIEKYRCDLNF